MTDGTEVKETNASVSLWHFNVHIQTDNFWKNSYKNMTFDPTCFLKIIHLMDLLRLKLAQ